MREIHTDTHSRTAKTENNTPLGAAVARRCCVVEREDLYTVERLLRTWCRVNVRRNKSLLELAEEISNTRLLKLLNRYSATSELVAAAFSCDAELVRSILRRSRTVVRTYYGSRSLLLASREFVTCSRRSDSSVDDATTFKLRPARTEIVSGSLFFITHKCSAINHTIHDN